jgi:superfamily I DNA and/or RNA helicase
MCVCVCVCVLLLECVILTLASNRPSGFLLDEHRINVACSRAKQRLYIVGDRAAMIKSSPKLGRSMVWKQIATYESTGKIIGSIRKK